MSNVSHVFQRAIDRPTAVGAVGCVITDERGVSYLDGAAGAIANSIGHGHPTVVAAMARQAATVDYVHATQFGSEALEAYATALAPLVPIDDVRVFPVSGGSEANETALKLARQYHLARGEDRHLIVARGGAYHGNTRGVLDASDRNALARGYEPWIGMTLRAPMVHPYRDNRSGEEIAAETERIILEAGANHVAALIAEPISGATLAAAVPPDDYWPAIAEVCRRHGILLVLDEVMTGFGRTGRWFAADHWGVRPDIITSGKGASSGYWPLGLCLASGAVHDTVADAGNFVHGFTWSHHPIGAAVANAVLDVMIEEQLVDQVEAKGDRCRARLRSALDDTPWVGDVRGIGMLTGVEFVADRETKQPFDRAMGVAEAVTTACFDNHMTVYPCTSAVDGDVGDAVLLGPPLSAIETELDEMVDRLVAAIGAVGVDRGLG
ncbi:MAG: aspartate aminotransferase family protein [Actinomycetia bacterium]|nr:aspartate aminotransferase family protein [Actinomycetes bacterium]MCP4958509.1 aspartate aminotransferase family protein [Actinomycetes bacterium]